MIKSWNYISDLWPTYESFCRNSSKSQQELLLELTWAIWPELPAYGRKAAQFVDLLGYFSLKTPQTEKKVCLKSSQTMMNYDFTDFSTVIVMKSDHKHLTFELYFLVFCTLPKYVICEPWEGHPCKSVLSLPICPSIWWHAMWIINIKAALWCSLADLKYRDNLTFSRIQPSQ